MSIRNNFIDYLNVNKIDISDYKNINNIYQYGENQYRIETDLHDFPVYDFKDEFYINEDLELNKPYSSSIYIDDFEENIQPFLEKIKLLLKLNNKYPVKNIKDKTKKIWITK